MNKSGGVIRLPITSCQKRKVLVAAAYRLSKMREMRDVLSIRTGDQDSGEVLISFFNPFI